MEPTSKTNFGTELQSLVTLRDELKLKAHLAKSDIKDELARLEAKLGLAQEEVQRTTSHVKTEVDAVKLNLQDIMVELKQGYENVKQRLV